MIQRHNIIVCLALLTVCAFASAADAGLLCGRRAECGRRNRVVRTCVCTCWTVDDNSCTGRGATCEEAKANARRLCGCQEEDVVRWECHWEIGRKRLCGRCSITICAVPDCSCCCSSAAAAKMGLGLTWKAVCHTESGRSCYGYGSTCAAAIQKAQANCSEPVVMCTCTMEIKRRSPVKQAQ